MGIRLRVRFRRATDSGSTMSYEFDQERIILGRERGADIQLPATEVSGKHASLCVRGAGYVIVDEGSTNGTRIGGERLAPGRPKLLKSGDEIGIGPFTLRVEAGVPVAAPTNADRTAALARDLLRQVLGPGSAPAAPTLLVLNGPREGQSVPLPPPPARLTLGRGENSDFVLEDADASREHVQLEIDLEGVLVRDLGSKNGFFVNGRAGRERRLAHRDELQIGATFLAFLDPAQEALDELIAAEDVVAALPSAPELSTQTPSSQDAEGTTGEAQDATPEPGASEAEPAAEDAPELQAAPTPTPRRPARSADWVIYVLAAAVLAASAASLVWLLGGS